MANSKTFKAYDLDGNGIITDKEMRKKAKMIFIENRDKREDAQRAMAWFSLAGMLLYPLAVVLASWLGLEQGSQILGDMAATYFVSVAAIVAAFYGSQAYTDRVNSDITTDIDNINEDNEIITDTCDNDSNRTDSH